MTAVRILADDLTGALDAGAPFAARLGTFPVVWDDDAVPATGSVAIDAGTRAMDAASARGAMTRLLGRMAGADIAFRKIDSLMRGNPVDELAACIGSGLFASVVVAPAYPAQRRVTRQARQYARDAQGDAWRQVGPDLAEALRSALAPSLAAAVRTVPDGEMPSGHGVFVCDADSEERLRSLCAAAGSLSGPVLWVGTAGLAEGFFDGPAPAPAAEAARRIFVIAGSQHPVTQRQIERLRAVDGVGAIEAANLATVRGDRGRAGITVVALDPGSGEGESCTARLAAQAREIAARLDPPDLFLATGGDTLRAMLEALGARALMLAGEAERGIATGRVAAGRWDGCAFLSKSGAFGGPETLVSLLSARQSPPAAGTMR